jgi:hypothetical protein
MSGYKLRSVESTFRIPGIPNFKGSREIEVGKVYRLSVDRFGEILLLYSYTLTLLHLYCINLS